jgi:hypothetical protein
VSSSTSKALDNPHPAATPSIPPTTPLPNLLLIEGLPLGFPSGFLLDLSALRFSLSQL